MASTDLAHARSALLGAIERRVRRMFFNQIAADLYAIEATRSDPNAFVDFVLRSQPLPDPKIDWSALAAELHGQDWAWGAGLGVVGDGVVMVPAGRAMSGKTSWSDLED